ncbi:hypothetical protein D3C81_1862750 [compost metagenome]
MAFLAEAVHDRLLDLVRVIQRVMLHLGTGQVVACRTVFAHADKIEFLGIKIRFAALLGR